MRPLNDEDLKVIRRLRFFDFAGRRRAKNDEAYGVVELIELDVRRAWKLISCSGPPCCPNSWFLQVDTDQFVYVESWDSLRESSETHSRAPTSRSSGFRVRTGSCAQ